MTSTTIYQYYMFQKPNTVQHTSSRIPIDLFKIELHCNHVLQLSYPQTMQIPLNTYHETFYYPRNVILSPDVCPNIIPTILFNIGALSVDIVDTMSREVLSFALEMDRNPNNAGIRVLTMVLTLFVITPYDDREEIDRAIIESMQIPVSPKFKPANGEEIEKLVRQRVVEDFVRVYQECRICLEEFVVGCEFSRIPCGHVYHADCIVRWLKTSHLCPLCRYPMPS